MNDYASQNINDKWIWISYSNFYTDGRRVIQKFRNVYGKEFLKQGKSDSEKQSQSDQNFI